MNPLRYSPELLAITRPHRACRGKGCALCRGAGQVSLLPTHRRVKGVRVLNCTRCYDLGVHVFDTTREIRFFNGPEIRAEYPHSPFVPCDACSIPVPLACRTCGHNLDLCSCNPQPGA